MRWCSNMDKYEVWLRLRREDIQKFKDKSMQFYFHTKQKSDLAFHLCWKVTMALLRIFATLSLILFLISWQHHWNWELLSSWQQEEQAPRTSGAQHLFKGCKVRDVMKEIGDAHHQQNRRNMEDTMQDLRDDQHLRTSSCLINSTLGRCLPHPCKLYLFWECCFWMMKIMRVKMTKKSKLKLKTHTQYTHKTC